MIRYLLAVALLVAACCVAGLGRRACDESRCRLRSALRRRESRNVAAGSGDAIPDVVRREERSQVPRMVKWFETNNTLVGIKSQTHFAVIYSDMPMYRDRYASTMPALPCVRLQAVGEDEPVAEFVRRERPDDCRCMARGLNMRAGSAECFRRLRHNCPQPQPQPNPNPDPAPQPITPPPRPLPSRMTLRSCSCSFWRSSVAASVPQNTFRTCTTAAKRRVRSNHKPRKRVSPCSF